MTDADRARRPDQPCRTGSAVQDLVGRAEPVGGGARLVPVRIDQPRGAHLVERVREIAVRTFEAVGAEGLSRVDVFVTPDERVIVNEINTMPGFTPSSMYPRVWDAEGVDYASLITELIELALQRRVGLR